LIATINMKKKIHNLKVGMKVHTLKKKPHQGNAYGGDDLYGLECTITKVCTRPKFKVRIISSRGHNYTMDAREFKEYTTVLVMPVNFLTSTLKTNE